MKVAASLIVLTITLVSSQNSFPPCKWSSAQWTTFKQCVGSQTNAIVTNCIRQQTSATDWNTIKNTICSNQSKKNGMKNCLLKDARAHSSLMRCSDRVKASNSG